MPRVARIAPSRYIYRILTKGINCRDIFNTEEDYGKYNDMVRVYKGKYIFKIYPYALMANHVNLILEIERKDFVLRFIGKWKNLAIQNLCSHRKEAIP
jgi:REP element-mobilizing transposase RayT